MKGPVTKGKRVRHVGKKRVDMAIFWFDGGALRTNDTTEHIKLLRPKPSSPLRRYLNKADKHTTPAVQVSDLFPQAASVPKHESLLFCNEDFALIWADIVLGVTDEE